MNYKHPVYTPFLRRFTDERARDLAETISLYNDVRDAHYTSSWATRDAFDRVSGLVVDRIADFVESPNAPKLMAAFDRCHSAVLALEQTIFSFPELDWATASLSLKEQVDLCRFLRAHQYFLANADRVCELLVTAHANLFGGLIKELPAGCDENDEAFFTVPLVSLMRDPGDAVDRVVGTICNDRLADLGLFTTLQQRLYENVCRASGIRPDDEKPRRPFITADESKLPASELVETYLGGTPFVELFLTPVSFVIPDDTRFEHMHIVAGSGHGKTQLLQHLIVNDLQRANPPSLVVIDSQGDMLRKIQQLSLFAETPDRLIVIDPEQYSPALNMFDTTNARAADYSELHREQLQAGIVELYNYIFASIAAEMTSRQSTAFAFVARLMLAIPGSTIHTLRELMEDGAQSIEQSQFRAAIETLEPTARAYFQNQFFTKRYADLKQQIARRLYGVLSVPAFDRMFSAKNNALDMFEAMQSGKVVLVNTSKALLKSDASALFGRYMIALVIRAVYERVASPVRHPTFLIVDEASEYFDDNIQMLLEQARKFNVGLVLAHQHLDQLSTGLRSAVAANTAIKMAGGVNDRDARSLAPDMRTTPEFISAVRKQRNGTQFACYIRNFTESALRLGVPFGTLETAPRMTDEAEKQLVERNRRLYAARSESPREARAGHERSRPVAPQDVPQTTGLSGMDADDWRS